MPATTATSKKFVYSPRAAQASASNFDGLMQRWSMASRMEASRADFLAAEQRSSNFTTSCSWAAAYNASSRGKSGDGDGGAQTNQTNWHASCCDRSPAWEPAVWFKFAQPEHP